MIRVIKYERKIQKYDEEIGEEIPNEFEVLNLEVTSDNDKDFNEQLETIKSYNAIYTIEEIQKPPTELELAIKELTLMISQLHDGTGVANTQSKEVESQEIFDKDSVVVNSWTNLVQNKTVEIEEVPILFNLKELVNTKMKEV